MSHPDPGTRLGTQRPLVLLFVGCLLAHAGVVQAGLGGQLPSVASDAQRLRATALTSTPASGTPTVVKHSINLPGGGSVVEYADANGTVFAVSWASPTMPDLSALLGNYRGALERAQQAQAGKARSPRMLQASEGDWVIVSTGHLRAYRGYSYLASQVPTGFDLSQLAP